MTPRYYQELAAKRAGLDRFDQFRHLATDMMDAFYRWAQENLLGTDCSGTICLPLLLMGFSIRTTARDLYQRLFVHPVRGHHERHVAAAFVITTVEVQHNDRIEPAGGVTHVMPIVGNEVVIDAAWGQQVQLRSFRLIEELYNTPTTRVEYRALDWRLLQKLSDERVALHGVDPIVNEIMAA